MMERNKYFVSVASKEIATVIVGNNADFTIYATDDEVNELRSMFNEMDGAEMNSFWRSFIPFMHYHHDVGNDKYDKSITAAFIKIHELGDAEAKQFIDETGMLTHRRMDN